MAKLGSAFDSGNYGDMDNFDPIPADEYVAKIVESDIIENKKRNGSYIKLKFEIIQGDYKGRFVWTNLNIVNPSSVAVEIAQKELATICRAIGKSVVQDTQELHGIPMLLKVKIRPAKGDYPASNDTAGYKPLVGTPNMGPSGGGNGDVPWADDGEEDAGQAMNGDPDPIPDDDIPF